MIPATEKDLENILLDFEHFKRLGNGEMKAAYLAASGRGFTEIVDSNHDNIKLLRMTDEKFIVFSYSLKGDEKPVVQAALGRVVKFHIDESVLK